MNQIDTTIKLDIVNPYAYPPVVIKIRQGDKNSHKLKFELYHDGEPYNIDTAKVRLYGTKSNGDQIREELTVSGHTAIMTINDYITSDAGIVKCQFCLYGENEILHSIPIRIEILKKVYDEDKIIKKKEYSELMSALQNIDNLVGYNLTGKITYGNDITYHSGVIYKKSSTAKGLDSSLVVKNASPLTAGTEYILITLPRDAIKDAICVPVIIGEKDGSDNFVIGKLIIKNGVISIVPQANVDANKYINITI